MIKPYLLVCCVSLFFFFCLSIPFKRLGIVDKPDGIRKIHKGEIPLSGGFSLFLAFLFCTFYLYPGYFGDYSATYTGLREHILILFLSPIILFLGLWDDIRPLPSSVRLIVQIFASWLAIIITDIYILDLGDLFGFGSLYLGSLGIPLTIFMVVGVCNAFNMLDGMDGLVGIVSVVLWLFVPVIAYINNVPGPSFLPGFIFIVFLVFNLGLLGRKRKIFLGDSGSTWLGFITAWFLIILAQGEGKLFQPITALWFILLPLIDALSTFMGRLWNQKSMFHADRTHIHHMLLDAGLKKEVVLLIFLLISVISSGFGIYANFNSIPESEQFYGFLTIWFFYYLLIKYPLTNNNKKKL
jgi:UDP-GlcNAc:undecaprenyl-phosphate GlcNAc-1-phosphate transferase